MADLTDDPESRADAKAGPRYGSERVLSPGPPRWVKVFGIIALIVVLLFIVLLLTGGHDPSRHTGAGDRHSSRTIVTEQSWPPGEHTPT